MEDPPVERKSLIRSRAISDFQRHFIPVFIIGIIILLMSSNLSRGASVDLHIQLGGREISLPSLFTFSLANTARDMWNAKIYPLFFLVVVMSGIWPYCKLILMLVAWIIPTTMMRARTREKLLLALDALGKFSLVDTYVLVLMLVAFRTHIDVSKNVLVDVFVTPETGFYSFLIATCASLGAGHVLVFYHRRSELGRLVPHRNAVIASRRESIFTHKFSACNSLHNHRLQMSRRFQRLLILGTIVATVLLAIGITRKSFKFETGGLAGDLLGEDRIKYYSLLSLGSSLRQSVTDEATAGIIFLEVAYYFYAVVTPFTCLGVLLLLLTCPMTLTAQRLVLTVAEIANAWSAVEVFALSIIAALLEISTFASFIVGDRCNFIKRVLREYFSSAMTDDFDATCYTVRASVEANAGFLIAGVLLNSFMVSILLRFVHCGIAERIQIEMEDPNHDNNPMSHDVLAASPDDGYSTIASRLAWGRLRHFVFDDYRHPSGYLLAQSTDTYSVSPDVVWDESVASRQESLASHVTTPRNEPDLTTHDGVMQTLRDAFD